MIQHLDVSDRRDKFTQLGANISDPICLFCLPLGHLFPSREVHGTRKAHKSRFHCDRVRFNTLLSIPRPRFQKYHAVPISRYNHSFKQFASMLLKQSTRSAKVSFRLCKSHLYSHGGHQFEYLATSYTIQSIENRAGQKKVDPFC